MMFGIDAGIINLIQSILLIISALLIIIATVGVLRIDRNLDNVVYARIHILGIVDIAGIIAFIAIGQPLFALIYLFLAPLLAHALANAYFHGEDILNNPVLNPSLEETSDKMRNRNPEERYRTRKGCYACRKNAGKDYHLQPETLYINAHTLSVALSEAVSLHWLGYEKYAEHTDQYNYRNYLHTLPAYSRKTSD